MSAEMWGSLVFILNNGGLLDKGAQGVSGWESNADVALYSKHVTRLAHAWSRQRSDFMSVDEGVVDLAKAVRQIPFVLLELRERGVVDSEVRAT